MLCINTNGDRSWLNLCSMFLVPDCSNVFNGGKILPQTTEVQKIKTENDFLPLFISSN